MTARGRPGALGRIAVALLLVALAGCAVNPATGKRQLVLISEGQEIALGRENDEAISAQMGLYEDEALGGYVSRIGRELASRSERPDLDWTFRVVDDPVVNAFALPGGYIYITRGILAHLNNEAELASVVGHEIGHVAARHGVTQMTKAQLAQLGLGVGSIVAPEAAQRFGDLAQTGLSLLFLKHGRDDERQADDLGLRYLVRAGYDPRPMSEVFDMLGRVSAASGTERVPGWMSTHPAPENRRERISAQIAALDRVFSGTPVRQAEYYARIENLTFGEDPREGFFADERFCHPELRFRMDFPEGWTLRNLRLAVVGVSPDRDAIVRLTLAAESDAAAALRDFFAAEGITSTGSPMGSIGGFPTAGDGFTAQVQQGATRGRVGFVEYGGRVFQLLGYAVDERWPSHETVIRRALASFDRLTDPAALAVEPMRVRIVRLTEPMSLETFARRHDATVPLETLALLNRVDPDARLSAGGAYKVVTGGRLP